ncbi:MAG TPA: hypothetical protein VNX21_01380, partial [Candidatus Thermoplasmatota archaeon]|nr:hypothetical protein [Candidatus Thermoplasmatota archaeon]
MTSKKDAKGSGKETTKDASAKARLQNHLMLDHALQSNAGLTARLVADPRKTLQELGLDEDALRCPPQAHEAYARGEAVLEALRRSASKADGPAAALEAMARAARERFGREVVAEKIPFGMRFREPVLVQGIDWTATGSVECSFGGLDCHADVDG